MKRYKEAKVKEEIRDVSSIKDAEKILIKKGIKLDKRIERTDNGMSWNYKGKQVAMYFGRDKILVIY